MQQHETIPVPVPERIAGWARSQPDRAAVVHGERSLTYAELHARAAALAVELRERGVGRDVLVPLWLPRSPELVVAALAVWLAGGAYVGMDVTEPHGRAADILADCAAPVVLTDATYAAGLPPGTDTLLVDKAGSAGWEPTTGPHDASYVTFTSGSTGRPKGAILPHEGVTRLVAWYVETFGVAPGDRMPQLARPSFDGWALETWPCLGGGATLCIMEQRLPDSPQDCVDWLHRQGITVAFFTTALAVQLLHARWPAGGTMRSLLLGGEKLPAPPPVFPPFRLHHVYGPTETTMLATCGDITRDAPAGEPPPIGRPLPGFTAHVLDERLHPVADGEPGELHLSGPAVGRGYLNRPELTAQRFRDDPFAGTPGVRMYATGDLVRRRPDGQLDFQGRTDDQVKLRGFRIEPGEIEQALLAVDGVVRAAVVVHETGGDRSRQLVGYWTGHGPDAGTLRAHLTRRLPQYMVPHALVRLDALPLTPHGKTDRRALADRPLPVMENSVETPYSGPTEELLARLWGQVLGRPPASRHDSFFDLGGDSLLAMRLASEARRHGLHFGAEDLFETDVLCELAEWLDGRSAGAKR